MPTCDTYTSSSKQHVLEEYRSYKRGFGFKSLAKKWKIRGDMLVRYWYQRWDGTQESLVDQQKSYKQRHLKSSEQKKPLLNISLSTVRHYGKYDWNLRWKKNKQRLEIEDETGIKGSDRSPYSLAPPNKDTLVSSVRPSSYTKRY
ncbi:unnamed protein product, partial [Rotaria sp. Silwood1]